MKSLFQNIRDGVITKPACESQLGKFRAEKTELVRLLSRRAITREVYDKKFSELNFAISLLEYVINSFDDLKLPLKIKRPGEVKNEPHIPSDD